MDIKIVDSKGKEVKQEQRPEAEPKEVMPEGEVLHQQIGSLFDLKPSEISMFKDNINVLLEYAKSMTDDHSPEGLKWAVRDLSYRVGTPPLGEKLINHLTLYAKLRTKRREINKQIEKIERAE